MDRWLRQAKPLGREREILGFGDRDQGAQLCDCRCHRQTWRKTGQHGVKQRKGAFDPACKGLAARVGKDPLIGACKQRAAGLLFQLVQRLADGRLRHGTYVRGPRQGVYVCHREKHTQVTQVSGYHSALLHWIIEIPFILGPFVRFP